MNCIDHSEKERLDLIDPDPVAVGCLCVAAASLCLQFAEYWRNKKNSNEDEIKKSSELQNVESTLKEVLAKIDALQIIVDRHAEDPELQYYGAKFRVSKHQLKFEVKWSDSYADSFAKLCLEVGTLSRWCNALLSRRPNEAAHIGEKIYDETPEASNNINEMIEKGRPMREVICETRQVLMSCQRAVASILDGRRRN